MTVKYMNSRLHQLNQIAVVLVLSVSINYTTRKAIKITSVRIRVYCVNLDQGGFTLFIYAGDFASQNRRIHRFGTDKFFDLVLIVTT